MHFLSIAVICFTFCSVRSEFETAKNPFVYLKEQNYYYENHTVVTEDGYRLLLVRIPYNRNATSSGTSKPPLLFVHGLMGCFSDFLASGPGIAFGYKAVEEGYDVFLLNVRGNRWSRSHTILDPDLNSNAYWNFSWHEIGLYDVSATIDYIINITGYSKVSYVGHSQGTTSLLVLTSIKPEYNEKIRIAILLAPIAYWEYSQYFGALLFKDHVEYVEKFLDVFQINEAFPYTSAFSDTAKVICSPTSVLLSVCKELYYFSSGPSIQINESIIPAIFANFPSGASKKQMMHFLQLANSAEFRQYDYGEEGNLIEYGQSTPPDYNLTAISCPLALYYGGTDYLADVLDINRLVDNLPNVVSNVLISNLPSNHLDVLVGTMTEELVSEPALNILNKYNEL